ncbi:MAG: zinc-ribbon domain-containing protein [Ktedonobacteraceae bacterium]
MTCSQCGTTLPESATYCLKCGATVRSMAFSYLPSGAPPWPTSAAEMPSFGRAKFQEEAPVIVQVPKQKRSVRRILVIAAFLLLAPLVGAGITLGSLWANGQFSTVAAPRTSAQSIARATATPGTGNSATATPATQTGSLPTPSGFLTATSSQVGITMQYPSDWLEDAPNVTTSGNTAIGFHPPQQLQTAISIGRLSAANSTKVTSTDEVNQANLQGFGSANSLTNPQLGTASQPTTIGGVSWDELDATYSDSAGATVHVSSISVKYKSIYYNVLFFAPSAVYDEAIQKYYSQMLGSFKFTV